MIVHVCAPNRLLDIGSWTDTSFAEYGAVLSCAIGALSRVSLRPLDRTGLRVRVGHDASSGYAQIERPLYGIGADLLRATARYFEVDGLEATLSHDLPAGCGLGVTASLAVAITAAVATFAGRDLSRRRIALIAHQLQCDTLRQECGLHGHLTAALGGIALYRLAPYPRAFTTEISLPGRQVQELERRLLLVSTGRLSTALMYPRLAARCQAGDTKTRAILWRLRALPERAARALRHGNYVMLGAVMDEHLSLQRRLCPAMVTPEVQYIDYLARKREALGVKVNGSGGSVMILASAEGKATLEAELRGAGYHVLPVHLDAEGLRIWTGDNHEHVIREPLSEEIYHLHAEPVGAVH